MVYNIGGYIINCTGTNNYFEHRCSTFACDKNNASIDMNLVFDEVDYLKTPEGKVISNESMTKWIQKTDDSGYYIKDNNDDGNSFVMMDVNKDWNDIKIYYKKSSRIMAKQFYVIEVLWHDFQTFLLSGMAYKFFINCNCGFNLHSSAISYHNEGIAFSAPSGTGKSTHTGLWKKMYGDDVVIINDDTPSIRYDNDQPMLCGTPWSGSTAKFSNDIVPLKSIVFLEQAPENTIERLSAEQALQFILPRAFLPYFSTDLMNKTLFVIEKTVTKIPIFRLRCRPDFDAVEKVKKCLML